MWVCALTQLVYALNNTDEGLCSGILRLGNSHGVCVLLASPSPIQYVIAAFDVSPEFLPFCSCSMAYWHHVWHAGCQHPESLPRMHANDRACQLPFAMGFFPPRNLASVQPLPKIKPHVQLSAGNAMFSYALRDVENLQLLIWNTKKNRKGEHHWNGLPGTNSKEIWNRMMTSHRRLRQVNGVSAPNNESGWSHAQNLWFGMDTVE